MAEEERPTRCPRRRGGDRSERRSERADALAEDGDAEDASPRTRVRRDDVVAAAGAALPAPPTPPMRADDAGGGPARAVQLFGGASWQGPKRTARQTVPFSMTEPVWLTTAGGGGCCITDLQFSTPSTVAELSFQNFYAATVDILVCKPAPATAATSAAAAAAAEALRSAFAADGHGGGPPASVGDSASQGALVAMHGELKAADAAAMVAGAAGGKGESAGAPGLEPEAAEFLRSLGLDLDPVTGSTATWEVSVRKKQLMPFPHFEMGSQDRFSVWARESVCPWTELLALRLVLRQPSPSWTVFGVSSVVAFRDPAPLDARRRYSKHLQLSAAAGDGGDGGAQCPLLAAVRRQTEAALANGMNEAHRDRDDHHARHTRHARHAGYEFFQLPKV